MKNRFKILIGMSTSLVMSVCLIAPLFFVSSCGGSSNENELNEGLGQISSLEDFVHSSAYTGKIIVGFDESFNVRMDAGNVQGKALTSLSGSSTVSQTLAQINSVLTTYPSAQISRITDMSEEQVTRQREKLERLSKTKLADWNSVYTIDAKDPDEAVKIINELSQVAGVKYVYPKMKSRLLSLATTPSLTGLQGYLYDEATHGGLNAPYAWNQGVRGENVYLFDSEPGMNFDHEEFDLVKKDLDKGGNYLDQPDCAPGYPPELGEEECKEAIAHGTAVGGILMAQDNNHGVTGFAPKSYYVHVSDPGSIRSSTYGEGKIEPGSVWVIEEGFDGKFSDPDCTPPWDAQCQYGGIPFEMEPYAFAAIQQAVAFGVTVIEAGSNGSLDLANPDLYTGTPWNTYKNMATEDSGAIMVGASEGANERKISFSNCGVRLNTFAWGQGVVTTGYPYGPYTWQGPNPPPNSDNNSFFVDMFGGTSSAAAMVGGAVALVQSHARALLGERRYIMPLKMREIIVNSGVSQKDSGCNIGKQPRVDRAMQAASTFVSQVKSQYPELTNGTQLTDSRMLAMRQLGVGIVCREFDPEHSDPICPDSEIYPVGTKLAKAYDFDGDGRADLVKFHNGSGQGRWSVDLSSRGGEGEDHFGAWDIELEFPPINGKWVWPYVEDMNRDGRADFVAYDKEHGTFYVALTDTNLIKNKVWHGWDWVLDYGTEWTDDLKLDPNQSNYSRPVFGDYNGDGFADIGIYCSDGNVRVDYGQGTRQSFSNYEWTAQLLTDEMLQRAPGWAYLVSAAGNSFSSKEELVFLIKEPDGLPDYEGAAHIIPQDGRRFYPEDDWLAKAPHIYGGNDNIPLYGEFAANIDFSFKGSDDKWFGASYYNFDPIYLPPENIYGNSDCHPVIGDFDGDKTLDRAVMCPDEWKIAYSDSKFFEDNPTGVRHIPLTYDKDLYELPGRTYSGGISYEHTKQLIELYQSMHPGVPPPILVDMVTVTSSP